jgi:hypothetical protein
VAQQCELALRRQRGFGFVEQVEASPAQSLQEQGEEGLAV